MRPPSATRASSLTSAGTPYKDIAHTQAKGALQAHPQQSPVLLPALPVSLIPCPLGCRVTEETQPPNKQVKPLFRHFRRIDSCLQTRVAFRGSDESECGMGKGWGQHFTNR